MIQCTVLVYFYNNYSLSPVPVTLSFDRMCALLMLYYAHARTQKFEQAGRRLTSIVGVVLTAQYCTVLILIIKFLYS